MRISFSLNNWCAYVPNWPAQQVQSILDDKQATDVAFLPPLKRRRLSNLTRLCLRLAQNVASGFKGHCVFGSQHGELVTTMHLLNSIVTGDIVSPAGFSASVHNTAVGLHSINNQNTSACTSIAAGRDTLLMCLVESLAILAQHPADPVLVVYADDRVQVEQENKIPFNQLRGFAALIEAEGTKGGKTVHISQQQATQEYTNIDPMHDLLRFLTGAQASCCMQGEQSIWSWQ